MGNEELRLELRDVQGVVGQLSDAAEAVGGVAGRLRGGHFGGPLAGEHHRTAGSAISEGYQRLADVVGAWSESTGEVAGAIRSAATEQQVTDAEHRSGLENAGG